MSSLLTRITISPDTCHGKPVIRNLRYPVESMLECLAGGDTIEDLLAEFPDLERDDLLACLQFAAESLSSKLSTWPWHEVSGGCPPTAGTLRAVRGGRHVGLDCLFTTQTPGQLHETIRN